jgi:hypothetical protein
MVVYKKREEKMKRKAVLLLMTAAMLFMLSSCSSVTVKSDYDPGVDFSKLETFALYSGKVIPGDELYQHPLIKKRVENNIKEELQKKGYKLVDEKDADFIVVPHAGVKDKTQITNWGGAGYGYGWYDPWWGPYGSGIDVNQYEESTLVIDIVSRKNKQMVWRGMGTGIVNDGYSSPEKQNETVKKYVTQILSEFPPEKR